ncbi:adrenodoxin-like [Chanos chanos]|uniref:Adrenodoxin-like n=1 Tax=Chanos chanos TaxID=29144 RepID=A0A6J2WAM5_CHACN|nr:adrenodoxin-like [Chanos chanos]
MIRTSSMAPLHAFHATLPRQRYLGEGCRKIRSLNTLSRALRAEERVSVNFINRDGKRISVKGCTGNTFLDVVVKQKLDFDGFGACEGTIACSTCHLIFEEGAYKQLGPIAEEEMDMLDLADGLTHTSRLGCQVRLSEAIDGVTARVPQTVSDARKTKDKGPSSSS